MLAYSYNIDHGTVFVTEAPHGTESNLTIEKMNSGPTYYAIRSNECWQFVAPEPRSLERTSWQGKQNGCEIAVNGGPFQRNGDPVGGTIIHNQTLSSDFPSDPGFGMTSENQFVLGSFESSGEAERLSVVSFATGFNWLVRNGINSAPSTDPTGAKIAARTALGVDAEGNLLVLVVDGCEKWYVDFKT